ncbi:MAG: type II/IV secretion system protein [Pseudomonadota bacterium]|nr:GspE/PulE family protein [Pseudomonadota bacterium]MDE3142396.1 type II/IV secretion system protein [Pseudomonadota bacterium]
MATQANAPMLLGRRGRLELDEVLAALIVDGRVAAEDAKLLRQKARPQRAVRNVIDLHPLVLIANAEVPDCAEPGRPLSMERLTQWLAGKAGLEYLKIDPTKIDVAQVTQIVSQAYAQRHRILPVKVSAEAVTFASAEPFEVAWAKDLAPMLRRDIVRVVANPIDINRYLAQFYGVQRSVRMARDGAENSPAALFNFEQLVELGKGGELGADDRHVVNIVDWLLQYAFEQRASDIHLEPRREMGRVRFRIDGVLHGVFELPPAVQNAVTARIKILARMDVAERRRPQDGRIKTRSAGGREVELRISVMPTAFGEKVVMRIFDPDVVVRSYAELGFDAHEEQLWRALVERPHGVVLVTGPTGSGKTTTLYSTLKHLARPELNVCTIEDPIEMVAPELNQMQVQPAIDLDFAAGVRTLLRQDPDIIMVGEIRDLETAQMAVQAALTGHLLLSTLHTNDAPSAITRLLDLGVPHYLIQSTLAGVVAQRLLRVLCPHCKRETAPDLDVWQALTRGHAIALPTRVFAPVGCIECRHTGYRGRIAVYEMLNLSPALRALVGADFDCARLTRQAESEGMRPLRMAGASAVARGITALDEVLTVLPLAE